MKQCKLCGETKPEEDYYFYSGVNPTRMARCKSCHLRVSKETRERNRDKHLARMKVYNSRRAPGSFAAANLKSRYGLTPEERQAMVDGQGGRCAVCGCPEAESRGGKLVVDHDHQTKLVRAMLCNECNVGLGRFKDNPDLLRKAADYLERS